MSLPSTRRVVVKVGTGVVARGDGGLALGRMGALVEQLHDLRSRDIDVLLVSSGAVGLGARRLGFSERSQVRGVVDRQACAAAGQGALMAFYDSLFQRLGTTCAQVLLTEEDFHFRQRFNNLTATLERLLRLGAVPILNENDTLSTAELALSQGPERGSVFGDNDRLSALVATYLRADLLVLLSNVDAVYTAPPGTEGARPIRVFTDETHFVEGAASSVGRGGMGSKIEAARLAARGGVTAVIASGDERDILQKVLDGESVGTRFQAHGDAGRLPRKKAWLAFATGAAVATVQVNAGARLALVERGASLLSVGVERVDGAFSEGDVVDIVHDGELLARGLATAGMLDADRLLVHRDHLVLL